ncbi:hypothetical protein Q8A73_013627 [Channa argus]|nr:hypothetical protein Q8A73_013627 [Channa argus]
MGVTYFLLSSLCLAFVVKAQDCSKPTLGPHMNLRDESILLQKFSDGNKVYLTCEVGYQPAGGSTVITCSAGSWSRVTLRCERKHCGSAGEITNGHVDYPEGTQFGDKALFRCDTGYTLVGNREITCGDKGWTGRLPECEGVKCSPPPVVVNGTFSPNNDEYDYRDVVLYSCNKDITLIGSRSITCSEDGTFNPEPPTCRMIECKHPQIGNGQWQTGSRPPHRPSYKVTLNCNSGYIMKGAATQTCEISGEWSPGLPTCEPRNCSRPALQPNMKLKDPDNLLQTFRHGTEVSLTCGDGYMSAGGSAVITCSLGRWSRVTLTCERKNCGQAADVTNGQVYYPQGTRFGDRAVIRCQTGYTLVGNREIRCGDKGWMGSLPVCEVVKCFPPPVVVNGTFSPNNDEYEYGDVVLYSCNKDNTLIGSRSITCSEDGTFKPEPPTCKMIECKHPQIVNGQWQTGSRPPHRPSSTVTLNCNSGYIMKGAATQTCEISGEWSPGLPTCEPVKCPPPPVVMNGDFCPNKEEYEYRDVLQYSCHKDFTINGSKSTTCSEDGTFKPDPPTCVRECVLDRTASEFLGGLLSTSKDTVFSRAGLQIRLALYERLFVEFYEQMLKNIKEEHEMKMKILQIELEMKMKKREMQQSQM